MDYTVEELDREIQWLEEEIHQDETVMDSLDASDLHRERLDENRAALQDLIELREAYSHRDPQPPPENEGWPGSPATRAQWDSFRIENRP